MTDLTEFVLARISEDEAAARYATTRDAVNDHDWSGWWLGHYQHYSRHDPARVLAECAALRAVVEEHAEVPTDEGGDLGPECRACLAEAWPCPTLRAVASIWAGAEGWREEWRL